MTPDGSRLFIKDHVNDFLYEHSGGFTKYVATGSSDFVDVSDDGEQLIFTTAASFVPEDQDQNPSPACPGACIDVYERTAGGMRLVSRPTGPPGAHNARGHALSEDGRHIIFSTTERRLPAHTDSQSDIYEEFDGNIVLVTPGTNQEAPYLD